MKINQPLLVMLCLAFNLSLSAQNINKIERNVLFSIEKSTEDYLIKTNITDKIRPEWRLKADLFYSYYYNNRLHENQGGYYGQLLDGNYFKFNNRNLLIEEGRFKKGLRSGLWKYWDDEGFLIRQIIWKNGREHLVINPGEKRARIRSILEKLKKKDKGKKREDKKEREAKPEKEVKEAKVKKGGKTKTKARSRPDNVNKETLTKAEKKAKVKKERRTKDKGNYQLNLVLI